MKKKSRAVLGIFALLFLCSPCLSINAEETTTPTANESGSEVPDESEMKFVIADSKLDRLSLGTDVSAPDVLDSLHLLATCSIRPKNPDADWYYVDCNIAWDVSTLRSDSVGYQTIKGIAVPDKPGFPSWEVTHRVLIYDPQGAPADEVFMEDPKWAQTLVTAPKGEDAAYYEDVYLNALLGYVNDHNEYVTLRISYDWSGVDLETIGMKEITYKVDIPDGLWSQKAEGVIQMYLMDPDGFSLGDYRYNDGILTFTWDKPVPDFQTKLKLKVAENEGIWSEYSYADSQANDFFAMEEGVLSIHADKLKQNVVYSFQLTYEEEQSDVAEAIFYRDTDGTLGMGLQYVEGKRDGDQGLGSLPPVAQPGSPGEEQTPATPNKEDNATSEAASTVIEKVTQNETVINGVRLGKLMKLHKDAVVFEKHGICIYLPTAFLNRLSIGDNELFQISIEKLADGFWVELRRDGVLITDITEYQIWLPVQTQEEPPLYIGESGTGYPAVKDEKSGMYVLSLTETGSFHLEHKETQATSKMSVGISPISKSKAASAKSSVKQNDAALAMGCLVVGLAGATILYRYIRRSKKIEKREK